LSTPLVTTLVYDWISIIIEQERYQIKDTNFGVPSQSPIISITRSYFGKLLRYTPFRLGGTNFGGEITFLDKDDERDFDERLGIDSQKFETYLNIVGARFSTRIKFPCDRNQEDEIELRVDKPEKSSAIGILNFNCEFLYEDIDSFVKKLDEVNRVYKKFKQILKKLGVETKQ
jgi:hypothetical protein